MTLGAHFGNFFDFAKKDGHSDFIGHGGDIKGPTAEQASKKTSKMEETHSRKKGLEKQ